MLVVVPAIMTWVVEIEKFFWLGAVTIIDSSSGGDRDNEGDERSIDNSGI